MSPEGSSRGRTSEVIVGLAIAVVGLLFFTDVQTEWKIIGFAVITTIGTLDFLAWTGWINKMKYRLQERSRMRAIRKHPEFIIELSRLNQRVHQVLYERQANYPSLAMNGPEIVNALTTDNASAPEFADILIVLNQSYSENIHDRITSRSGKHSWKTDEFVEIMRGISGHLTSVSRAFDSINRLASRWPRDRPLPALARTLWEQFRMEYNEILHEWRTFTNRFDSTLGWGTSTQARLAEPLPEP